MFTDPAIRYRNLMLLCGSMLISMGALAIAPSVANMSKYFSDIPNADILVKLAVTLPSLAVACTSFIMGSLLDRFGRRPVLLTSAFVCGFAGTAGFFLDSLNIILLSRVFLGIAIAGLMTSLTTIAGDVFSGPERDRFLGLQSMAMNAGGIIFVGIGGALADISWRMPFWLYSLAFLLFVGFFIFIQETGGRKYRGDQSASKTTLDPAVNSANKKLVIFRLVPLFLCASFISSLFYMVSVQMGFVFEDLNLSATKVGIALGCMSCSSALMGFQFRRLIGKLGNSLAFTWVFGWMAVGYLFIGYAQTFPVITIGLIITGWGVGMFIPLSFSLGMKIVPENFLGVSIGVTTSAMFTGQFLSSLLAAPFLAYYSLQEVFAIFGQSQCIIALCLLAFSFYKKSQR